MKNISLAINAVLLVLIIALFFMYSSLKKSISPDNQAGTSASGNDKHLRIAYINADSINSGYKLMKAFREEVQQSQSALQGEYETKARKFQDELANYQQRAQAGTISQIDAQKAQQDLQNKKGEIDDIQRRKDELVSQVQDRNMEIQKKVQDYVNQYNKTVHFDYVLGYTAVGGTLLSVNDNFDITRFVLEGLNKQYSDSIQKLNPKH